MEASSFFRGKIPPNLPHPLHLSDLERGAPFAVSAPDAGVCPDGELFIVASGQLIAEFCQVIIFIDQPNINPGGAGRTVIAVDAAALPQMAS